MSDYIRVFRDEWVVVLGVVIMLSASVNAVFWLVYGGEQAAVEAPWAQIAPEDLYNTCLAKAAIGDVSDVDFDQIQQGYPKEIAELIKENSTVALSRAEIIRHVLSLRLRESCSAARQACSHDPTGQDCRRFAEEYML